MANNKETSNFHIKMFNKPIIIYVNRILYRQKHHTACGCHIHACRV